MIVFGTYFGGKTEELDNQWIETKYFLLMVPLFPINCMLVNKKEFRQRSGMEIELNGKSLGHGYLRFLTFLSTIGLMGYSFVGYGNLLPYAIGGTLSGVLWCYSFFVKNDADEVNILDRKVFGSVLGVNALPEWYNRGVLNKSYAHLKTLLLEKYPNGNASAGVTSLESPDFTLIYTELRFGDVLRNTVSPETVRLKKILYKQLETKTSRL